MKQVSIALANVKGSMQKITQILENEKVNILGSVNIGFDEFGTFRMIVEESERVYQLLTEKGYFCSITDVIAVTMTDEVGNFNHLLKALGDSNINVDYSYLSCNRQTGKPIMIIHTDDIFEVMECLSVKGFEVE